MFASPLVSHLTRKALLLTLVSFLLLMSTSARLAQGQVTSTNWVGYAVNANGVTAISASWTIPAVQCISTAGGNQVTQGLGVWIGFDGFTAGLIPEQLGTNSVCLNGSPIYVAWEEDPTTGAGKANHAVEAYPEYLSAGDRITASITYSGSNHFQLIINDAAMGGGRTYNVIIPNAPRTSAEWIVEAYVNVQTQQQVTLPVSQPITFSDCSASVNNVAGSITQNHAQTITLVGNNGKVIASPQNLNQAGTSFQVVEGGSAVPEFTAPMLMIATTLFVGLLLLKRRITVL